ASAIYPAAEFIGARHDEELRPYFSAADLFVLPGTGGLAVQEAMSNALPVIVAQGDGTQDDLVRAGNGWQVPPDDFDALLAALKLASATCRACAAWAPSPTASSRRRSICRRWWKPSWRRLTD
ncbi:MAG TPA: glycosyltransferase, partial [Anaerolineales bacterium]